MADWYSRPVLFVADVDVSSAFYISKLGFAEKWRHADDGVTLVAQVQRDGCEIILSCQWLEKNGKGMLFISLTAEGFAALPDALASAGVTARKGYWGYSCVIVDDPDGNQLYFPHPGEEPNDGRGEGS